MRLPRLAIAAPSTGQGKTTVATGLMAALRQAGHVVSGHKVGPDYIDPGYHALATGRPGRNLDPHLVGVERIAPLLLHGAAGADVAVVEGAMGLHDGRIGGDGFASTAHVAALTRTPVVLVLDIARQTRTVAAIAAGLAAWDPAVTVAGVVLNRAGSPRNTAEVAGALERTGLPVLGVLPRDEALAAPSRHLGLVPASERAGSAELVAVLGEQVARHLDLSAIIDVARSAPDLDAAAWDPRREVAAPIGGPDGERPVVAVAGGRAFTFRYAETEELLRAAGCEVVAFDPLVDRSLPAGTRGLYLGGGFPEVHAAELAANTALLGEIRDAVAAGLPTVAECAGLLYLADTLDGVAMAGSVPAAAAMSERLTLRYPVATAAADSLLTVAGEQITGHEFHRTVTTPEHGARPAWVVDGQPIGFATDSLHASYLHVHWAGHPLLAARFAAAVHGRPPAAAVGRPDAGDPLLHHGDVEATPGLHDFAVNVYDGPRPAWLESALVDSLADAARYPDAAAARAAVARRHGRPDAEALPTAGGAEAFTLLAEARAWRRPVVVHPQFTEPHAALERAGHVVDVVHCRAEDGFALDPAAVPEDADLVVVGNPTNPTGVLHPAVALRALCRPGRVVAVDEAFMDAVPGEPASLAGDRLPGLVVLRSLTKHWSIPGIRAGYVVGDAAVVADLAARQTPWSVSAPALAACVACSGPEAAADSLGRALQIDAWRAALEASLRERSIEHLPSAAPFVLARIAAGGHAALRAAGVAVRRADTFPGLGPAGGTEWVRIAVRPPDRTLPLLEALDALAPARPLSTLR